MLSQRGMWVVGISFCTPFDTDKFTAWKEDLLYKGFPIMFDTDKTTKKKNTVQKLPLDVKPAAMKGPM